MCGNIFNSAVVQVERKILFGNWMTLSGENLEEEYALIWAVLAARIRPIADLVRERYGLRGEIRPGRPFAYWAAVELAPGAPVPAGMVRTIIASGPYLSLFKSAGRRREEVDDFIYRGWEGSQKEYFVDREKLCLERYGPVGQDLEESRILAPLKKRTAWPALAEAPPPLRRYVERVTNVYF